MLRDNIRTAIGWLRRAVTQPMEELNRWQMAARYAYDLGRYGAHQLREDRAPQMAAALAFRTLFGLAPVLVVATVLVKSIRGADTILNTLREFLNAIGLDQIQVVGTAGAESDGTSTSLAQWLEELAGQLANLNLSAIGWVGLAVIVYAAIGLMVTIENSFNLIYRAPDGRAWARRVPLYWFILTLSPALMVLASFVNEHFNQWIASVNTWHWLLHMTQVAWTFSLAWLFMFAVYALIPNASVPMRPAIIGSFVATVLLAVGKNTLGAYLGNAFTINQLYGSLGLVPVFMLWVYLMWLAVLFGLQVSATLHMLHGRSLDKLEQRQARTGLIDPATILAMMELVATQFCSGQPTKVGALAEYTGVPLPTVSRILERLVKSGWLHQLDRPESAVTLAKPPAQIPLTELLSFSHQLIDENQAQDNSSLTRQLRKNLAESVQGQTLQTVLDKAQQPAAEAD